MTDEDRYWMGLAQDRHQAEIQVNVLAVPYDGAISRRGGAGKAPEVMRKLSRDMSSVPDSNTSLSTLRIKDWGDVAPTRSLPEVAHRHFVDTILSMKGLCKPVMVLGGDHSVTSAVIEALCLSHQSRIGILWIDAHPDLMSAFPGANYPGKSDYSHASSLRRIVELPEVKHSDVVLIGTRSMFEEESSFIREHEMQMFHARDLAQISAKELSIETTDLLSDVESLYISVDIDVLDPGCAPGTGVPVPGGLSSRYLLDFLYHLGEQIAKSFSIQLSGFDVVEVAPALDINDITSMAALKIVLELLGLASRMSIKEIK